MGACPPSQLGLLQRWEGLLVNERVMEYSKDRLNQQIRDLMRENGHLRDALFRKDFELNELRRQMDDAEKTHNFLSVTLGVVLLAFMICTVYAIRLAAQVSP